MFNFIPSLLKLILSWISWLLSKGLWTLADYLERRPLLTGTVGMLRWQRCTQEAAGEFFLSTEQHQDSSSHGILSGPIELSSSPCDAHTTTTLGTRFYTHAALFSVRNHPNESLSTLCARNDAFSANNSTCIQECDFCRSKGHIQLACCIHVSPHAYVRRLRNNTIHAAK